MSKPCSPRCYFYRISGPLLVLFSTPFLLSLLIIPFESASLAAIGSLLLPGMTMVLAGSGLTWRGKTTHASGVLSAGQACAAIVTAWFISTLLSVVPITILSGLDITRGVYESVAGWTTTSFSLLDLTATSGLLILFRGGIQFTAGIAAALMLATAFSFADGDVPLLTGPTEAPKGVYPRGMNLHQLFRYVCILYGVYFALGLVLLLIADMNFLDAVIYSFSAVSTGGFTPGNGGFDRLHPAISVILIILMFLGSLNVFITRRIVRGQVKALVQNGEIRLFLFLAILGTLGLRERNPGGEILPSIFQVFSAMTSTGFTLQDLDSLPAFHFSVLLLLTAVGGYAGSAAGGIKLFRINQLSRGIFSEFRRFVYSGRRVRSTKIKTGIAPVELTSRDVRHSALFLVLFIVCIAIGTLILTSRGAGFRESIFEITSALSNNGLSTGSISIDSPSLVVWTHTAAMILGRFEFYILFLGIAQLFKRTS